jgi:hypothetical protein
MDLLPMTRAPMLEPRSPIAGALRSVAALCVLATTLLLASCEGEVAGVGGEGSGGTAIVGRVDGFGSTIVEGQRLDDASALVDVDVGTPSLLAAPLTAVKLGAQVSLQAETNRMARAAVTPELVGRIDVTADLAAGSMLVLGQRVVLNHPLLPPVLDGLVDLAAGTVVEVHGLRLANGDLVATRVQGRSPLLQSVQLAGTVSEHDAAARSFRLHGATVSYSGALLSPAGTTIANGQRVTVFSAQDRVAGTRINAVAVRVDGALAVAAGTTRQITGFASEVAAGALLRVRGERVDASEARFNGTSLADLRADQLLRVRGVQRDGLLHATEITLISTTQSTVQITAAVADYSDADASFRMRGTSVRFDAATQFIGGGTDNLGNGVELRLQGRIEQGDVVASRVEFVENSPVLAGVAANIDATAGTFRVPPFARLVRVTGATRYRNGLPADVMNGQRMRVSGSVQGNELVASEIVFLDVPTAPLSIVLAGRLSAVQAGGRVFVNDTPVRIDSITAISGGSTNTVADLNAGLFAIVRAVRQNNVLVARSIDIRAMLDDDSDNLLGYVSEFRSLSDLRVGNQRVDAAQASIVGGSAATLGSSAYVLMEGNMNGGVFVARRIEILPN